MVLGDAFNVGVFAEFVGLCGCETQGQHGEGFVGVAQRLVGDLVLLQEVLLGLGEAFLASLPPGLLSLWVLWACGAVCVEGDEVDVLLCGQWLCQRLAGCDRLCAWVR